MYHPTTHTPQPRRFDFLELYNLINQNNIVHYHSTPSIYRPVCCSTLILQASTKKVFFFIVRFKTNADRQIDVIELAIVIFLNVFRTKTYDTDGYVDRDTFYTCIEVKCNTIPNI